VLRGGSWAIDGRRLRSAVRGFTEPSSRDVDIGFGFRLVRPEFR
jgi:formylglycine-generating enzyme required for sulfatase activity